VSSSVSDTLTAARLDTPCCPQGKFERTDQPGDARSVAGPLIILEKIAVTSHFPPLQHGSPLCLQGSETDLAVTEAIRRAKVAKIERERAQQQLWRENDDFKETIRSKLDGRWDEPQFTNFSRCGLDEIVRTCKECGTVQKLPYRCNVKWCPRCAWRVTAKRKEVIALFASKITQPKHLVLTQRNFQVLTNRKIKKLVAACSKLRKRKCFKQVRGGCISIEITNEGNGWHLHTHWLLDVDWLPMADVAVAWARLVNQEFAICKVKDVREKQYLNEVCKYVVEGSELAKWEAEHINQFVRAAYRNRFFFSFGSLYKLAPALRAELARLKPEAQPCECGCNDFKFESLDSAVIREILKQT